MNPIIKYIDRSFEQIVNSIKSKMQNPTTGIPEITDYSDNNDFMKMVKYWGGIAEMLGYWINVNAREQYLQTVKYFKNAVYIANQFDYRVKGAVPSIGYATFTIDSSAATDLTIPIGTILESDTTIRYATIEQGVIKAGELSTSVAVRQWEKQDTSFVSNGNANQILELGENISDIGTEIKDGVIIYSQVDSFAYSYDNKRQASGYFEVTGGTEDSGTNYIDEITVDGISIISGDIDFESDKITTAENIAANINAHSSTPNYSATTNEAIVIIRSDNYGESENEKTIGITTQGDVAVGNIFDLAGGNDIAGFNVYRGAINKDNKYQLKFGNGTFGNIPTNGNTINVTYYKTEGSGGNIYKNHLTTIVDTISLPAGVSEITVNNNTDITGGADSEGILEIKNNVPLLIRTKNRAITEQDFKDIVNLALGVHNSELEFQCGKNTDIYILPKGGGIAANSLLQQVYAYMQDKKIVVPDVNIKPVGEVYLTFNIALNIKDGYSVSTAISDVTSKILEEFGWFKAKIKGAVALGDIYQSIEGIESIRNSFISEINIIPYVRSINTTNGIVWTKELINTGNEQIEWTIIFTDTENYILLKNGVHSGNYRVTELVIKPEIEFTILDNSYLTNEQFKFITYPNLVDNGKIELSEFSIITTREEYITITTEGGI